MDVFTNKGFLIKNINIQPAYSAYTLEGVCDVWTAAAVPPVYKKGTLPK